MNYRFIIFIILLINNPTYTQDFNLRHIKTVAEKFPYLTTSVQIYDSFNEPVINLENENFSVSVDGKISDSIKAFTYRESGLGLNITLCLDLSGSMRGTPIETMKKAILKFIDDMRTVDKLSLLGFANDVQMISDFSNNKDYLKEKVKNISTSGNQTALYYGAYRGLRNLIDNQDKVGKILLLIGDGKNESSSASYTENDIIELANKEGIPIFTIGYTKIDRVYLQSLRRISEKTGGNFYDSPADDELERQYSKLYRQILNIYLINYFVTGIYGSGAEHMNVITVSHNGVSKTVSSKFIAPADVYARTSETQIIEQATTPLWYYFVGVVAVLFIVLVFVFKRMLYKKRKAEQDRLKDEEERKNAALIQKEREEKLELEKQLKETGKIKFENIDNRDGATPKDKTIKISPSREERTIILKPGEQVSGYLSNLRLEIVIGPNQGKRFDINERGAMIGRNNDNEIVIDEETVSGNHAKVLYDDGSFYIEDLNSSNGTYINGKKITYCKLNQGDVFKFGKCEGQIILY